MELIKEIGSNLDNDWKKSDYDLAIFPELSASYLKKYGNEIIKKDFDYLTIALKENKNISSDNSYFGNCNIRLYQAQKFYIEVVYWSSSWTSIHEHGFCGAFLNLKGERFIGRYKFKIEKEIENNLKKGILTKEKNRMHERRRCKNHCKWIRRDT